MLVEAQLRVAQTFGFDHVSVIAEPARKVGDCGGKVEYSEHQPPALVRPLLASRHNRCRSFLR